MILNRVFIVLDLLSDFLNGGACRGQHIRIVAMTDKFVLVFRFGDHLDVFVGAGQIHHHFYHDQSVEKVQKFLGFLGDSELVFFTQVPVAD